jgi:multisubunit Na+/H+ antiporter MnhB subunit
MTRPRRPAEETTIDLIGPSVQVIFHAVVLASVYLLVAGHNHPGGGFVGGLVASAGIAVRYITGGIGSVRRLVRLRPWTILGAGLLIAGVTAAAPLLVGRPVLSSAKWAGELPGFGPVTVSSVLAFDLGVYLVVVGLTLMVFEAFGDDYTGRQERP